MFGAPARGMIDVTKNLRWITAHRCFSLWVHLQEQDDDVYNQSQMITAYNVPVHMDAPSTNNTQETSRDSIPPLWYARPLQAARLRDRQQQHTASLFGGRC